MGFLRAGARAGWPVGETWVMIEARTFWDEAWSTIGLASSRGGRTSFEGSAAATDVDADALTGAEGADVDAMVRWIERGSTSVDADLTAGRVLARRAQSYHGWRQRGGPGATAARTSQEALEGWLEFSGSPSPGPPPTGIEEILIPQFVGKPGLVIVACAQLRSTSC